MMPLWVGWCPDRQDSPRSNLLGLLRLTDRGGGFVSRPLQVFLCGLLALLCVVAYGIHWLGFDLARLAFWEERRAEVYWVLDLHNPIVTDAQTEADAAAANDAVENDAAEQEASADFADYVGGFNALAVDAGGEALGTFSLSYMPVGRQRDQRLVAQVTQFGAASEAARFLTDTGYRDLRAAGLEQQTLLGAYNLWETWPAVWLLVLAEPRAEAGSGTDVLTWFAGQSRGYAQDTLRRPVSILLEDPQGQARANAPWSEMLLVAFASPERAAEWLRSDAGRLTMELAKARVRDLQISLYITDQ